MKIRLITVGKLKETYLKKGIEEYSKRLSKYCKLEVIEVADEKVPESLSEAQMIQVKEKEGERILAKIGKDDYVYILSIDGKKMSSEEFSHSMKELALHGKSTFTFIIGGSLGLSSEVLKRGQQELSFGNMTYPHQLMRLILVEQIYRSFRIWHGHAYHK